MTPHNLTTLEEVKKAMRSSLRWSSFTAEAQAEMESFIWMIIDSVSEFIITYLNRNPKNVQITEYLSGTLLTLSNHPVIEIVSIQYDPTLEWTDPDDLESPDDYELDAEAGIIDLTFEACWRSIKVQYKAGKPCFTVMPSYTLPFNEGASTITATITSGMYNAWDFADAIAEAMTDAGTQTYTCNFDSESQTFTIEADSSWEAEPSADNSIWTQIGLTEDTSGTSITSEFPLATVPKDLVDLATELVLWRYKYYDKDRVGVSAESRGDQSLTYHFVDIPYWARRVLDKYRNDFGVFAR